MIIPFLRRAASLLSILFLLLCSSTAPAHAGSHASHNAGQQGDPVRISGKVIDKQTGEGISHAYMHFEEVNRSVTTRSDGRFVIPSMLPGRYTLYIHRIGYETRRFSLEIRESGMQGLEYQLSRKDTSIPDVIVEGQKEANGANMEHASLKITGDELRRNMGNTLSQTLENTAGFTQRSLGPVPGRPVVRGLSGERVLVLQDRLKTGDVSSISADHAVTSDPMAAREIELARGPAALEYSGNAVGGVINVVKDRISSTMPGQANGSLALSGQSVNSGASGSGSFQLPFGAHSVLAGELNATYGLDFNTPQGSITNSYTENFSNALSYSHIRPWGYTGITADIYSSDYGIPPDPAGGHPAGVDIEMDKFQLSSRSEVLLSSSSVFRQFEATLSFTGYEHQEIESNGSIGTEFIQNSYTANMSLEHHAFGLISRGKLGADAEVIDYRTAGNNTSDATRTQLAAFSIQEADKGRWHFELGNRLELATVIPEAERNSSLIGRIKRRDFIGLASSASAIYRLSNATFAGASALAGFRPPSIEELYSEGPHLAAYTFEVGNPELSPERSIATEIFMRQRKTAFQGEIALFYNYFNNYIFPRDTGQRSVRFPDLNNFQFEQAEAHFLGAEATFSYRLHPRFRLGGNLAFTKAERVLEEEEQQIRGINNSREALPLTPPLSGLGFGEWSRRNLTLRTQLRFAAEQTETDQFETSTDGYAVWDASLQYVINEGNLLHTISLRGQNLMDASYRNHLSLIKDIFPEPGRNLSLLYRMYF